ncbi:hypothetical protein KRX52_08460 [Pseudomonas sp. MAP12]|uniref:Beta-ketoadipyl CoA thiolase n=1 Tax=Geopseudomonas aromaticivorans TaxID=2849492 RepID=A0ABS6MVJ9_9GAMM|nr:hypothetical protein [Pseudomonas aromaticivorans]MBV2132830.1 hypothetical protein [Pseudomonas aromaticivorans]
MQNPKDLLREQLAQAAEQFKNEQNGEVVIYAAQPAPEKRPWRKKPSIHDEVFAKELDSMRKQKTETELGDTSHTPIA